MQSVPRLPVLLLITGAALLALHGQRTPKKPTAVRPGRIPFIAPYIPPLSGVSVFGRLCHPHRAAAGRRTVGNLAQHHAGREGL
jgi:hypothetical protein